LEDLLESRQVVGEKWKNGVVGVGGKRLGRGGEEEEGTGEGRAPEGAEADTTTSGAVERVEETARARSGVQAGAAERRRRSSALSVVGVCGGGGFVERSRPVRRKV
jgi:hypothetical protein